MTLWLFALQEFRSTLNTATWPQYEPRSSHLRVFYRQNHILIQPFNTLK